MIEQNERVRRLVILLWVLVSGLLLWLMNKADVNGYDDQAYFKFVTFIFSGSFAFQILYDLSTSPISVLTKEHWAHIGKELSKASFTILVFIGIVNFEAHVKHFHLVPSMLAFGIVVFRVIGHAQVVHKIVKEIQKIES